jgi:hypothetical protein
MVLTSRTSSWIIANAWLEEASFSRMLTKKAKKRNHMQLDNECQHEVAGQLVQLIECLTTIFVSNSAAFLESTREPLQTLKTCSLASRNTQQNRLRSFYRPLATLENITITNDCRIDTLIQRLSCVIITCRCTKDYASYINTVGTSIPNKIYLKSDASTEVAKHMIHCKLLG